MRRSILLLPFAVAIAALCGCGQKGPLYLPPAKAAPARATSIMHPVAPAALPAAPASTQPSPVDAY